MERPPSGASITASSVSGSRWARPGNGTSCSRSKVGPMSVRAPLPGESQRSARFRGRQAPASQTNAGSQPSVHCSAMPASVAPASATSSEPAPLSGLSGRGATPQANKSRAIAVSSTWCFVLGILLGGFGIPGFSQRVIRPSLRFLRLESLRVSAADGDHTRSIRSFGSSWCRWWKGRLSVRWPHLPANFVITGLMPVRDDRKVVLTRQGRALERLNRRGHLRLPTSGRIR